MAFEPNTSNWSGAALISVLFFNSTLEFTICVGTGFWAYILIVRWPRVVCAFCFHQTLLQYSAASPVAHTSWPGKPERRSYLLTSSWAPGMAAEDSPLMRCFVEWKKGCPQTDLGPLKRKISPTNYFAPHPPEFHQQFQVQFLSSINWWRMVGGRG